MIARFAPCVFVAAMLCGCTIVPPPASGSDAPPSQTGKCDAVPVQKYLGEFLTEALTETIRKESGAEIVRTGGPSDMWTMDYREERVSIGYGNGRIIERIACG